MEDLAYGNDTIMVYPKKILHWIDDKETPSLSDEFFQKLNPATGQVLAEVARGGKADVDKALDSAMKNFKQWSQISIVKRADILREATMLMQQRKEEIAQIVALETGKSSKDALGEVGAAIEMGFFVAGEGRRFYGRTTTSAVPNRSAYTIRQPIGVCGLITAANTPIANVAWKAFPALLCGNTAIMKAPEDTPYPAIWFAKILKEAGLPPGVFFVIQGFGKEVGASLVEDERVDLISFTGSVQVGRFIQKTAGQRLVKVCLELGGKNPLVVCDDADLESAAECAVLSAFSNAGQRCASASRIIIFDSVYEKFKNLMLEKTKKLKVGPTDEDDLGPVINEKQLKQMLEGVEKAVEDGAKILIGGHRLEDEDHKNGFYMTPTILENVSPEAEISWRELFGPITCLYKVQNLEEAIKLANNSPYGLTAAIHTRNIHRAQVFQERCSAGVVSVNGPTYGSEPHMPFGGLRDSGNGFREAGTEALDVYSEWKTIYIKHNPDLV